LPKKAKKYYAERHIFYVFFDISREMAFGIGAYHKVLVIREKVCYIIVIMEEII
jgi:hypothetical protein